MRISNRFLSLLSFAAFALAVIPVRSATITTYNDPASWQAASSTLQPTITFEGLAPANGNTTYQSPTGVTTGGVEFIGYLSNGSSWIEVLDTNVSPWYNFGSNDALVQSLDRPNAGAPVPYIHIVLPADVTSAGMDLFTASPNAATYTITINGTQYSVPTNARPTQAFWGFTSDTPISSIDLTLQGTVYNGSSFAFLDNFQYGIAAGTSGGGGMSDAPEATTFVLIGSGLFGIAALRKLLGKNAAPEAK